MKQNMHIRYVSRDKDAEISAFVGARIDHKNVLLVEGARQVGKTWLVEHALSQRDGPIVTINLERDARLRAAIDECEDFREYEQLLKDRLDFDGMSGKVLFIDEAQESSRLGRFVRFMKEEWPRATVILSGSSLQRLFRAGVRFPVGRVSRLQLAPFCISEFLSARGQSHLVPAILAERPAISGARHENLLQLVDEFLVTGGLPAVVCPQSSNEEPRETLARILADYEEDFRRIFDEEIAHIAKACMRSVANHLGSASKNTTVMAGASGSQSSRISEVFGRLEAWRIILRSHQLSLSPEKSHNYLPKRYLFDTGLAKLLREAAVPTISGLGTIDSDSRKPLGGIIENQVAIELSQQFGEIQGWKKSPSGNEVDFVVKKGSTTYPIECKAALRVGKRHLKGLRDYLEQYDMPLGFTVSLAPYEVFDLSHRRSIINIPIYMIGGLSTRVQ